MVRSTITGCAAAALLLLATAHAARGQAAWNWEGRISAGQTLEVLGVHGDIQALAAPGSQARVRATRTARSGSIEDVSLVVVEHAGGVTICAVYPANRGSEPNSCAPGAGGRNSTRSDVRVDFVVEIPANARFTARTVSGDVTAAGLAGDVDAATVSGDIDVSTTGTARASTVNGSIDATVSGSALPDDLTFSTVNGSITLAVVGGLDANLRASTVSGTIDSDFPITLQARNSPRSISGTIGRGGRDLRLSTVNGDIELRRR